jgi:hypothetical protein
MLGRRPLVAAVRWLGAGLLLVAPPPPARGQEPKPAPTKSVRGKLLSVDRSTGSVLMTEDGGAKLAWHFDAPIVAEAARFKPGDPVIVIYRQTSPQQKRVTALAFPGTAKAPIYVNLTGERVVLRSAAGVDGACDRISGSISESTIPAGGLAEVVDACWCCAPAGSTCTPGTRSGLGRAFLAQCFR